MNQIKLPLRYNYIGVFLTYRCQMNCNYCVSGDTQIMTPSGFTPIKDIKVGDEVIGFEENTAPGKHRQMCITKVKQTFSREAVTLRIKTSSTHIDITKEHPIVTERGWKKAGDVSTSNLIRYVAAPFQANFEYGFWYKRAYLKGVFDGDGTFQIGHKFVNAKGYPGKQYSASLRMWDDEPLIRANKYIYDVCGYSLKEFPHRIDTHNFAETVNLYEGISYKKEMIVMSNEVAAGYLAGIFDAEGSFSGNVLRISNTDKNILSNIKLACDTLGFNYVEEKYKCSTASNIRIKGGIESKLKFFWLCRPSIQRKWKDLFNIEIPTSEKVLSTEPKCVETVYNLETESQTYIANGLCVHNCINKFEKLDSVPELSTDGWARGLSRIVTREDLPITIGGGEPTIYAGFDTLVRRLQYRGKHMDLLTNGMFDLDEFCSLISPDAFKRKSKYANIRFSFHADTNPDLLASKAHILKGRGYSVGIWGLDTQTMFNKNREMKKLCNSLRVDFRLKDFLSHDWDSKIYKYPGATACLSRRTVMCKPSELLINPAGYMFRCHRDMYANEYPLGHILDKKVSFPQYLKCENYGHCSPCDIKIKYNRFQQWGHCSVRIKFGKGRG